MMQSQIKQRDPIVVFLLGIPTFGIYWWYWLVKTKGELNASGAPHIPTAWIWLIPFVGVLYWLWKYAEGAEVVIKERYSNAVVFLLVWLLGGIGFAIMQDAYNKIPSTSPTQPPVAQ